MAIEFDPETDRTLREIAEDIAASIKIGATNTHRTADLLIEFAEEIKRQAIEP